MAWKKTWKPLLCYLFSKKILVYFNRPKENGHHSEAVGLSPSKRKCTSKLFIKNRFTKKKDFLSKFMENGFVTRCWLDFLYFCTIYHHYSHISNCKGSVGRESVKFYFDTSFAPIYFGIHFIHFVTFSCYKFVPRKRPAVYISLDKILISLPQLEICNQQDCTVFFKPHLIY